MDKFNLLFLMLIGFASSAFSYEIYTHKYMQIKTWREPEILNRDVLRTVTEGTIEQSLDHFDASVNETFSMRYYKNELYFKDGGPIIIFLGGEWAISPNALQAGFVHDLAKTENGIMFYTEHRYYGYTRPTSDLSSKNLRHLSVDQALADVALFIEQLKQEPKYMNSPVIVIGGSYSANMAAWMRAKYPHLVQGALASSAPILAKSDFHEYLEVVENVLRLYGDECVESVNSAFKQVSIYTKTSRGLRKLKNLFNLCDFVDVNNKKDLVVLLESLNNVFKGAAQYDRPEGDSYISEKVCRIMTNKKFGAPISRLAVLIDANHDCIDVKYENMVNHLKKTSYESENDMERQWLYQTCTEYGYYQTTTKSSIFGNLINIKFYEELCGDLFGINYNKKLLNARVKRTNVIYGGRNPEVTNVIYTNGSKDPWHALSRLTNLNHHSPSYFINGTSHCYDLQPARSTDSEQLKQVRKQVMTDLSNIIQEAKLRKLQH